MEERFAAERYDSLPEILDPAEQSLRVRGQDRAADFLVSAYKNGTLPSGLILAGIKGIGKATFAHQFASFLFNNPDRESSPETLSEPDVTSATFRQVASGAHQGLLYLSRPYDEKRKKFKTQLTVDEVRAISRFVGMTAPGGGYRVVIVDSADDMNTNAANALLKNLEEPPPRTVFLLISHRPGRLLPTIRSRCQFVRFDPLADSEISIILDSMSDGGVGPETRREAIGSSGGSVRQAILLTQFGGLEIAQAIAAVVGNVRFDPVEARKISDVVGARDKDVQFSLFNDSVAGLIAKNAKAAATRNQTVLSNQWASLWRDMELRLSEALAFNLDRKQHVMGVLSQLQGIASRM